MLNRMTRHGKVDKPYAIPANRRFWCAVYERLSEYEDLCRTPDEIGERLFDAMALLNKFHNRMPHKVYSALYDALNEIVAWPGKIAKAGNGRRKHRRMARKRLKKLLMSAGFDRDAAEGFMNDDCGGDSYDISASGNVFEGTG